MTGMFDELLDIKKLREQSAASAVKRAKEAVLAAEGEVKLAQKSVHDHEEFRVTEELRLFEEIHGEEVKLDDIDEMKFKIGLLRTKTGELEKTVEEKTRLVAKAREAVQAAMEAEHHAKKAVQKFEEFVDIQHKEEEKLAVAAEEAEIEEITEAIFAGRRKGSGI